MSTKPNHCIFVVYNYSSIVLPIVYTLQKYISFSKYPVAFIEEVELFKSISILLRKKKLNWQRPIDDNFPFILITLNCKRD